MVFVAIPAAAILQSDLKSRHFDYSVIDAQKISRYNEDRVAFQHVNKFIDPLLDDAFESLLIIRKSHMYLFIDGYDDPGKVRQQRVIYDTENKDYDDQSLWVNKFNGQYDYVLITDRRIELMRNVDEKFVNEKFGAYTKAVKEAFLKRYVTIFKDLMRNRKDSGLVVDRGPIEKPLYLGAPEYETKYYTTVSAKTIDETVYYCEDGDGDGITETFTVSRPDGFNWGYKSGANIILIYNARDKGITDIIGDLAKQAYFGTDEERTNIINNLPKEKEIIDLVEDIVPEPKFYK
jgi:hypothetical protein